MSRKKKVNKWADDVNVKINPTGRWLFELTYIDHKVKISPTDDYETPHGAWRGAVKRMKKIYKQNQYPKHVTD